MFFIWFVPGLGQYLQGTASFAKDEGGRKTCVVPFKYFLPEQPPKKKEGGSKEGGRGKRKKDAEGGTGLEEALRDTKLSWLPKLGWKIPEEESLYKKLSQSSLPPAILTSVHAGRLLTHYSSS